MVGHAVIIEEICLDCESSKVNPQGAIVITPAHTFEALLEPRVVFEHGTPMNNYVKSIMHECGVTICDIRRDQISYDPIRIKTILDEKIEYVVNSFLLRKIQHPDTSSRSTIVQMCMLRDDLIENRRQSTLYKEFAAGLPQPPRNSPSMPAASLIGSGAVP